MLSLDQQAQRAYQQLQRQGSDLAKNVYRAAADDGVATKKADNLVQAVQDAMWQPTYSDRQE